MGMPPFLQQERKVAGVWHVCCWAVLGKPNGKLPACLGVACIKAKHAMGACVCAAVHGVGREGGMQVGKGRQGVVCGEMEGG